MEDSRSILTVENLRKVYPGNSPAVDNVSFAVAKNEIVGLLGANGAGKTTIMKSIATVILPTSGKIIVGGVDAQKYPAAALEKVAAVMEGNRNVYWRMTALDNLKFFAGLQGLPWRRVRGCADSLLDLFELRDLLHRQVRELSRGTQQKLAIACAIIKQTPLLLLDEPTLGLDIQSSRELRRALKRMAQTGERTILLSTHDMNAVEDICDRVIIIQKGRVVTEDRIDNLKELFRASAYRFEIRGELPAALNELLSRRPAIHIHRGEHGSVIDAQSVNEEDVYHILELLRQSKAGLLSMGRQYPDLEEIFLKIIHKAPSL